MIVSLTDYEPEPRFDSVPWTQARIEEAAAASGPWTAIETIALNPVDADPSEPVARSFTTTHATLAGSGWYRVVWVDGAANESATPPVQNSLLFASAIDLGHRLGIDLTEAEENRANYLLTVATGLIRQKTKQTISLVTNDVFTRPGDYSERIRLKERPVVSVSSVTLNGTAFVDGTHFYRDGDELVRLNWNAVFQDSSFGLPWSGWGFPWWPLVVTYTHGYAVIPDLVKAICVEAVRRVWTNPGGVIQESIAGVTTTYAPYSAPPAGLLITDAETRELNDFLRRTSGTISLR